MRAFADVYRRYVHGVLAGLAQSVRSAHDDRRQRVAQEHRLNAQVEDLTLHRDELHDRRVEVGRDLASVRDRLTALRSGPEARSERELLALTDSVGSLVAELARTTAVADTARRRADGLRSDATRDLDEIGTRLAAEQREWDATTTRMRRSGWGRGHDLPALVVPRGRAEVEAAGGVLARVPDLVRDEERVAAGLLAAVDLVDTARLAHGSAAATAAARDARAAESAAALEQATGEHATATHEARRRRDALAQSLAAWARSAPEGDLQVPEPAADDVARLPLLASALAEPARSRWLSAAAGHEADLRGLAGRADELREQRRQVEVERDPKPPAPAVHRDDRAGAAGAPLWRLVDFVDGVAPAERAAVEAALEGAGVLDAWVPPDGVVLDGRFDAVLGRREHGRVVEPVQGGAGRTLRELLRPDEAPPGCGVAAETVVALLGQIGLDGPAPDLTVAVARDGRWWAGDLAGRTTKSAAQYIGTGAREAERARRLAGFDQQLAEIAGQVARVEAAQAVAQTQLHAWTAFVDTVPDGESLLQSWRALDVATTLLARARTADDAEQQTARTARSRAAELLTQLQQLASTHGLPVDQDGLGTRRAQVEDVAQRLSVHRSTAVAVTTALARWSADDERANREADEAELREHERATAHARHEQEARRLQELSDAVGDDVQQLRSRIEGLVSEEVGFEATLAQVETAYEAAIHDVGRVVAEHQAAQQQARDALAPLRSACGRLAEVVRLEGFLGASAVAGNDQHEQALRTVADALTGPAPGLPRAVVAAVDELRAVPADLTADLPALMSAWRTLESGPGAAAEPRLLEQSGAYRVTGRDEGGEHTVTALVPRLENALAADRELLSEKERRLFEEHVLGDLGHVLRERRREAQELVSAMNQQLDSVSTSQGIRVRLRWQLRDDVPADVRKAVQLLGERVDALLPDERHELRTALHRLIEASRAEAPEDSYTEHLARALDYRQWHEFRIRYLRPEGGGTWLDLRRKSPLSQGEQKVVCYLPLFAAAAAHFTSLAGAAPHAPRIVLLDDAFPKIDARTHPKLFGLLVDLDLDFVVTSERLWGDHDTVPSLAIYEALRDPGQRGIAQFHHRWDGRRLHSVGG